MYPSLAFVAVLGSHVLGARADYVSGTWTLEQSGTTGVSAMQLSVVSATKAIIYDKVEHNPLKRQNGLLAWAAEYDLTTDTVRALNPLTNSFCAAGSHLSNGTLVNTGGNPADLTSEAGDENGYQGIRLFDACTDGACDVYENPDQLHLTSNRWYPSTARLDDGSIFILGGGTSSGYINSPSMNNPTYEFYPPKNINGFNGTQIPSQFMVDTLNGNFFPHIFTLPDGRLFIAANQGAMLFDWKTNTESRLPNFPNGVRVTYPFQGAGTLLPLSAANGYTPTVLLCGGSTIDDTASPDTYSAQTPASNQCARMTLTTAGIAAGWQVESLPEARVMGEGVLLPDGRVLIINGAQTGVAGYGNVAGQVGQSNADNPAFQPVLYDPTADVGSRFSTAGLPVSTIARMYHSTATLVPDGRIMIAGSNPNADVTTTEYQTEYRVEWLSPPYLALPRPTYTGLPATIPFGQTFTLGVTLPSGVTAVTVSLIDLGFATHGVHMDQRLVVLAATLSSDRTTLTVTAPPNAMVYPPGPGYLYVVTAAGVPSVASKTLVGTGAGPPVSLGAIANMLKVTSQTQAEQPRPTAGEGAPIP